MCNFLNFSYGSQFEKRHKMATKAHDYAGNMAHWVRVKPTCVFNNSNKLILECFVF